MKRIIPPVLVIFLFAALAALDYFHPETLVMRKDGAMLWDIPLVLGLGILFWGFLHFSNKAAEIHTFKKPTLLVTDGPFRLSRNPMYVGFILLVLAAAFYVNTWCALVAPLVFFLAAALWYIPHEEQNLREVFGSDYDNYAWNTRRWI